MKKWIFSLLALCALAALCGCGAGGAASMHLVRAEGTLQVSDEKGQQIKPKENLGLFSGYGLVSGGESYGWISLDHAKLVKMDQNSDVAVTKEDKQLVLEVRNGNLFFNVTKPLEEDETMTICAANMAVGIRGTCGWVEAPQEDLMRVYLLHGSVECTAGQNTGTVQAGQTATLTADGQITVEEFSAADIAAFVSAELMEDEALAAQVKEATGMTPPAALVGEAPDLFDGPYADFFELQYRHTRTIFTGMIDFEQDGDPELVVVTWDGQVDIYRFREQGPEPVVSSVRFETRVSLMESDGGYYVFLGTGPRGYGAGIYYRITSFDHGWQNILGLGYTNNMGNESFHTNTYHWASDDPLDSTGLTAEYFDTKDVYLAQQAAYREVLVIACKLEDGSYVALPDPALLAEQEAAPRAGLERP